MIKIGDKVITRSGNKYGRVIEIWYGVIDECIKVEFIAQDGLSYIYRDNQIKRIVEEDNAMSKLTGYKQVAAIKMGGSIYYYAIFDDGRVYYPGDKVIVSGAASGTVHTISEIIDVEEASIKMGKKNIIAEVIGYVDTSAYDNRMAKRKEAEDLKKKMDHIIKEMDENNRYEMYAERNPELKQMLEIYKKLTV